MKLISIELARVSRFFDADEIRPPGGFYPPEVIRLVTERYGFTVSPSVSDTMATGAIFQHGRLIAGNKKINIPALGIYNDGVSVSAFDTDIAEQILQDVILWAFDTFALRKPISEPLTFFESSMVVEFEQPLEKVLTVFSALKPLVEAALERTYHHALEVYLTRIGISSDPAKRPPLLARLSQRMDFGFERRLQRPYTENRHFCVAPLRTRDHMELLESFEKVLVG